MRPQPSPQSPSIFSLDRYGIPPSPLDMRAIIFRLTSFPLLSTDLIAGVVSISNICSIVERTQKISLFMAGGCVSLVNVKWRKEKQRGGRDKCHALQRWKILD